MKKILSIFPIALAALAVASCDTKVEKLEIQHFNTYDLEKDAEDPYYQDLREWKQSKHTVSYVYFARWAPPEGATSLFIEYKTMRPRLMALPDSLDIVNLWMGTPMKEEYTDACFYGNVKNQETGEIERAPMHTYDYSPNAYADLEYCQKVKGTRFVMHADASHYGQEFDLLDEATGQVKHWVVQRGDRESIEAYAKLVVDIVTTHGLDGVDFDYEGWDAGDRRAPTRRNSSSWTTSAAIPAATSSRISTTSSSRPTPCRAPASAVRAGAPRRRWCTASSTNSPPAKVRTT